MDAEQLNQPQEQDLAPTAERLMEAVPRLWRLISSEAQATDDNGSLSMTQLRAMALLHQGRRLSSELARELGITPATMSEVIDLLVRKGLVERGDQPQDRRLTPLRVTPDGLRALKAARQRSLAGLQKLLERMEPGKVALLEKGLADLQRVLKERVSHDNGDKHANGS
ncbi:MAG: MarR family transcriptional regulator [Dehalococcoidales bacterium]|nr:MarR family transcriptional regulator [Dehalococcoidales bacterium]